MRALAVATATIVLVGGLAAAPVTLARFNASATANASFSTGTLAAPTSLAGTGTSGQAVLTWTPSTSSTATGYELWRSATSGSGYAQVTTVTPVSAATATDAAAAGTWYYVMRTYVGGWTSAYSNEATVPVSGVITTAYKGCTNNAAVTSNAGDNNGYESSPGNACAQDGLFAVDNNSGSGTSGLCTSNQKDRHTFWGYAFGVPSGAASIKGITISAVADQSNNGGTTSLCIQLSWDGGGTWSTAKSVTMTSNSLTTYTFGGATDTWGRTWVPENLLTANFRVRVIDVSTQPAKTFRLDYLGVAVTYQP